MSPDPQRRSLNTRWRVVAATVIGAALLTGAGVHSRREGYAAEVASRPTTDVEIAAKCQERYTD